MVLSWLQEVYTSQAPEGLGLALEGLGLALEGFGPAPDGLYSYLEKYWSYNALVCTIA